MISSNASNDDAPSRFNIATYVSGVMCALPLSLVFLYFLDAFVLTFPDTAYMDLIDNELKLSQSAQSLFYATIMIPWYFKPFYGWIVGRETKLRNIRVCLVLASAGSATSYFVTAALVRSSAGLYAATILRAISNAFSELCLGMVLVRISIQRKGRSVGVLQAIATGARAAGSLVAYIVAVPLYPCEDKGESEMSARGVIALNSALCLLAVVGALYLPTGVEPSFLTTSVRADDDTTSPSRNITILCMSLAAGFGIFWISETQQHASIEAKTPSIVWYGSFAVACAILLCTIMIVLLYEGQHGADKGNSGGESVCRARRSEVPKAGTESRANEVMLSTIDEEVGRYGDETSDEEHANDASSPSIFSQLLLSTYHRRRARQWRSSRRDILAVVCPAIFLFLYNATPSAETQWSNLTYSLFESKICYYQYLGIVTMSASIVGSALYSRVCSERRFHLIVVVATCANVCAGLLRLPIATHANELLSRVEDESGCSHLFPGWIFASLSSSCVDVAFGYLSVASFVMSIFNQIAMIPLIVLAVKCCPISRAGVWYGMFLSCIDLGNSVSGWISAPVVDALDITLSDYSGMTALVLIESVSKIAILCLVPLLLVRRGDGGRTTKESREDASDDAMLSSPLACPSRHATTEGDSISAPLLE